jgi:hypothetical protein
MMTANRSAHREMMNGASTQWPSPGQFSGAADPQRAEQERQ